jgi:2,3-bisphosphoglycerate-dependent phosphoglycerate mutase
MKELPGKLVLMRHGESTWNAKGQWTGTRDMHLTAKGKRDSRLMGAAVKDIKLDVAWVSQQVRAKETLEGVLEACGQQSVEQRVNGAINERDYGVYTGLNKWKVKEEMSPEDFQGVRRGWDYPIPRGERLKDVYERSVPFFREVALQRVAAGHTVLLVAHGNSIRSLMKYIESISDAGIGEVEMIFGTVLIYRLDADGRSVDKQERKIDSPLPNA